MINENINFKNFNKNIKKCNENNKKISKNDINQTIFDQISKDFVEWINGIQEDEPLKTEAKNIYFILEFKQNDIVFSYSADEKLLKIFDYGAYFPIEAEYLYSKALKSLSKSLFVERKISKNQVVLLLKQVVNDNYENFEFFKNHNIYFGNRLTKNQAKNCLVKL